MAVPDEFFLHFGSQPLLQMLVILLIAVPMYICSTGSIPVAAALMMKGLSPGAALVMLMAGPACNVASMLVVGKVLGRRTLAMYLASIIGGAVLFGFAVDYLLPCEWFTSYLSATEAYIHEGASCIEWTSTVILVLLLLNVIRMKLTHHDTCCCHHEAEEHSNCCCHHEEEEHSNCCCHHEAEEEHHEHRDCCHHK